MEVSSSPAKSNVARCVLNDIPRAASGDHVSFDVKRPSNTSIAAR